MDSDGDGVREYADGSPFSFNIDVTKFRTHMERVRDQHTEHVPVLIVGAPWHVWGANTRLGNVPKDLSPLDEHRGFSRPVWHEQIYIRQGARSGG